MHQQNVLEVNKTNFKICNTEHPLHNWTTGTGRDEIPLNVTKTYYFVSGNGFCYGGMKLVIHVEKPSPPPSSLAPESVVPSVEKPAPGPRTIVQKVPPPLSSLPQKSGSPSLLSTIRGQILISSSFCRCCSMGFVSFILVATLDLEEILSSLLSFSDN